MKHVTGFENNSGSQRTSRAFARLQSAMLGVFATEQIRIMAVSIKSPRTRVEARPSSLFCALSARADFAVQISKDRASSWTVTLIDFCNVGEVPAGKMHLDLFRKPVPGLGLAGPSFGQRRDRIGLENLGNIHLEMNK